VGKGRPEKVINIGVAAHITAAAKGGQDTMQNSHQENGDR
jgi:hypothetical protein